MTVAHRLDPVLPIKKISGLGVEQRHDAVAGRFQGPDEGMDGGDPEAAARAEDRSELPDLRGPAQRPDIDGHLVSRVEPGELLRGRSDDHENGRHRPSAPVPIGDGQRDPLALGVRHDDDELPGPAFRRDLGRVDLEKMDIGDEPFAAEDPGPSDFPPDLRRNRSGRNRAFRLQSPGRNVVRDPDRPDERPDRRFDNDPLPSRKPGLRGVQGIHENPIRVADKPQSLDRAAETKPSVLRR